MTPTDKDLEQNDKAERAWYRSRRIGAIVAVLGVVAGLFLSIWIIGAML